MCYTFLLWEQETILWESSMNFFLPLREKTPTPESLKQKESSFSRGAHSLELNSFSTTISRKTFGISSLGGLFLFNEQEPIGPFTVSAAVQFSTEPKSLEEDKDCIFVLEMWISMDLEMWVGSVFSSLAIVGSG